MDGRGAEILLAGVDGGWDARAAEEDQQAGAVLQIAGLETTGVGGVRLVWAEGTEDELIDSPRHDRVVAGLGHLEHPLPGYPASDSRSGLVRANHRTGPDLGAHRLVSRLRPHDPSCR